MAKPKKRILSDGSVVWDVRYRAPDGRQPRKTFKRKIEAERYLISVEADKLRGAYVDPRAGRVTVEEFLNRWLALQVHLRPNTRDLYRSHIRTHVVPALGRRELGSLKRSDMKSFVALLVNKGLAPSTVAVVCAPLRSALETAVEDGLIAGNPLSRVKLPEVQRRGFVLPTDADDAVLRLTDAITPRYAVAIWTGAGAGLRLGEALGLLVPRVDFLRRRVLVEEQLQPDADGVLGLAPLKTRGSRRIVPVDDVVLEAISEHIARFKPDPVGLLVTNRSRRPVRRHTFEDRWRLAVKKAGLPQGMRFHDLRHYFASSLISAGLHPKVVQARLGHATISETMDTYGHLFPDSEDAGRGALDARLRRAVPSVCHEGEPG